MMSSDEILCRTTQLKARLQQLAEVVAQEAGLKGGCAWITAFYQAEALGHPWRDVDAELVRAAKNLLLIAERPVVLAVQLLTQPEVLS